MAGSDLASPSTPRLTLQWQHSIGNIMPHENSITVGEIGRVYNIPTVVNGKDIGEKEATHLFFLGKLPPLQGPYKTFEEGVAAAELRSDQYDPSSVPISPAEILPDK